MYTYTCMYIHICIYIYMYMYMYIPIHKHNNDSQRRRQARLPRGGDQGGSKCRNPDFLGCSKLTLVFERFMGR